MDIIAVAEGKLVPVGEIKVVQPLETAVVKAIHVEEGSHVRAGDVLIELDPTDTSANLESLRYDHNQALLDAEAARILLAGGGLENFVDPPGANPVLSAAVRDQTREELARLDRRHGGDRGAEPAARGRDRVVARPAKGAVRGHSAAVGAL